MTNLGQRRRPNLKLESLENRRLLNAMLVDVRIAGTEFGAGKAATVVEGGTITLGVYLRNINLASDVSADAVNGLGNFNVSLQTFGEKTNSGSKVWPTSPTAADTVINATGSTNSVSNSVFDLGFSNGTLADLSSALSGSEFDPDTDTDLRSMSATQADGGAAYQTGIGVSSEVLLGTVTYTALDLDNTARPLGRIVAVNTYFTSAAGGFGGLSIKGLVNSATDDSNSVGLANLVSSAEQIGAPVIVTVVGSDPNTVSGRVFFDKNANGIFDGTDEGIGGFRVYLDEDADGVLDEGEMSKPVSATGTYTFTNVPSGTYRVREVFRDGWRQTFPAAAYYELTLIGGQIGKSLSFANTDTILIKGRVWMDADKDKVIDAGEGFLPGWTLWLDQDNDAILDAGEKTAVTNVRGEYRFFDMPAGKYVVRAMQSSRYRQTTPGGGGVHVVTLGPGESRSNKNFGFKRLS